MSDIPKVSVKTTTYNHERFIGQAIESVLMQQVNFNYEMVIGEDCSTDRTREIVMEYQKKHPDRIRLLLREKNTGPRINTRNTLKSCRGQYIAVLDGDDYWTSPHKLQKQVDFLDSHPECTLCFHNANILYEDGQESQLQPWEPVKPILTLEDILVDNPMTSLSMIFRNHLFEVIPKDFDMVVGIDWLIQILCAEKGHIGYINEVMGTYRIHSGGIWSEGGKYSPDVHIRHMKCYLLFYRAVNAYLEYKYDFIIKEQMARREKILRQAQVAQLLQCYKAYLTGVYEDGWLKPDVRCKANVGADCRVLVLRLMVPQNPHDPTWQLSGKVSLGGLVKDQPFALGPGLNDLAVQFQTPGRDGTMEVALQFGPGFYYAENPDPREFRARIEALYFPRQVDATGASVSVVGATPFTWPALVKAGFRLLTRLLRREALHPPV